MRTACIGLSAMVLLALGSTADAQPQRYDYVLYEEWNFAGTNNWDNGDGTGRRYGDVRNLRMDVFSSVDHSVDGEVRGNPTCILDLPQDLPRWITIPGKQGWGLVITYRLTNPNTDPGSPDASFELFDMAQNGVSAPNEWRFLSVSGQWNDGGNNLEVYAMGNRNNAATRADGLPQRTSINGWNRFNNKASANYQTVSVVWNPGADGGTYWTYDGDPFEDPGAPLNSTTTNFPHWSGDDDFTPGESRRRYVGMNYAGNATLVGDISYVGLYSLELLPPPYPVDVNTVSVDPAVSFWFDSEDGVDYEFQYTDNQTDWIAAGLIRGDGGPKQVIDPADASSSQRNYRMEAQNSTPDLFP